MWPRTSQICPAVGCDPRAETGMIGEPVCCVAPGLKLNMPAPVFCMRWCPAFEFRGTCVDVSPGRVGRSGAGERLTKRYRGGSGRREEAGVCVRVCVCVRVHVCACVCVFG